MGNSIVSQIKSKAIEQAKQMAINAVPTLFAPDPPPAGLIQAKPPLPMFQVPGMMNPAGAPLAQSVSQAGSNNTGDTGQAKGSSGSGSGSSSGKGSGTGKGTSPKDTKSPPKEGGGAEAPKDPKAKPGDPDTNDLSEHPAVDATGKGATGGEKGIEKSESALRKLADEQKALEAGKDAASADVAAKEEALRGAKDNLSNSQELAKQAEIDQRAAAYGVEKPSDMGDAIRKTEDSLAAERGVARAEGQLAEASKGLSASEDALRSATAASDAAGSSAKTLGYSDSLKGVGKKVLGPVGTAIDAYQLDGAANRAYDLCQSGQTDAGGKALWVQAGDTVGGNVGAGLGAAGGAVVGSGVASVPAAIGGGIAGGYAGSAAGKGAAGLVSDYVPFANDVACDVAVGWHDTKEFAVETGKAAVDAASDALDTVRQWIKG